MPAPTDNSFDARLKAMRVEGKYKQLQRDNRKRNAETDTAYNYTLRLQDKKRGARAEIALHKKDREEFGYADEARIAELEQVVADIDAELAETKPKPPIWPELAVLEKYIASQQLTTKWRSSVPEIKIPKGSTALDELARIRAEVDAIRAAIRGAEIAWLPAEEALQKAIEQIDRIAVVGAPDFRGLFRLSRTTYLRNE